MRSRPLQVVVEDMGADACLYASPTDDEARVLYVRPGQSFESAVQAVQAALGDDDDTLARHLVRKHLPDVLGLEEMVEGPAPVDGGHPWSPRRAALWVVVLAVILALIVLAWALLQAGVADDFRDRYVERPGHLARGVHSLLSFAG